MSDKSKSLPDENAERQRQFTFGHWTFSSDLGDLSDGETTTRLEPQVAKLLAHFLTHQNQVISRDELIAAAWRNRIVSYDAINRCVSILRQTLTPDDQNAYIETVVRKGYLAHFPSPPLKAHDGSTKKGVRIYRYLVVLAAIAVLAIYLFAGNGEDANQAAPGFNRPGPPMVAVLPFTSSSRDSDDEFFANGVHNDLLTQLAKLQSMRVISATSVKEYRDTEHNMRRIGEELGADVILEGNVQTDANRIRINAQLIDAKTDEHLWAESYDRELTPLNLFDVQREIARDIADAMSARLTEQDNLQLELIPTQNMAAYRAYHRAMQLWRSPGVGLAAPEYIQALEEAVQLDPGFSRAWAELVTSLSFANFGGDRPEMTLRAEQALEHLQEVAPGSSDLLIGQAGYVYYILKDYGQAYDIISQALVLNPSDVNAWQLRSWLERRLGLFDNYLASRREASRLDPRDVSLKDAVLGGLWQLHRYDDVQAELDTRTIESFGAGYFRARLIFRENRDFKQFHLTMQELCLRYEQPDCGWVAMISNRDYDAALGAIDGPENPEDQKGLTDSQRRQIQTYWLYQQGDLLAKGLPLWQQQLQRDKDDSGSFNSDKSFLHSAMLLGIEGRVEEALQVIEHEEQQQLLDWTKRVVYKHEVCRVLGLIAATQAAVNCIRQGITDPSYIDPFMEPYLPFYDSIREAPEFIQMLFEIDVNKP